MPRAYDPPPVDPAVGHRCGQMWAELAERRYLPVALAAQHQSHAVDLDSLRLAVMQRVHRQRRGPVCGAKPLTRLVDTDTGFEHQRTAHVAAADGDSVPDRANRDSRQVATAATLPPRHHV